MFSKFTFIMTLLLSTQVLMAQSALEQAAAEYNLRDYNAEGVKHVEAAIELYNQALNEEQEQTARLKIRGELATTYYFLGSSREATKDKIAAHEEAMDLANKNIEALGADSKKIHQWTAAQIAEISNKLNEEQRLLLAEAMYSKGVSLAQWGNLNGVASSIGRLPEVLGLMDRIEMMNLSHISEYGPYRTIGRINFVLPALFGGDLAKSEEFLTQAYRQSLVEGQRYSSNGYNNLYLAETLHKRGKENQAKRLLETFLQADFDTLAEGSEPENREALRVAQDLFDSWN